VTTPPNLQALHAFQWSRQPGTEAFLRAIVQDFLACTPFAAALAQRMTDVTGTRFFDWIDCIALPGSTGAEQNLRAAGYKLSTSEGPNQIFRNAEGVFPRIILTPTSVVEIALKVDAVADFLAVHQIEAEVEGEPFAPFRRATVAHGQNTHLSVVERRGAWTWTVSPADSIKRLRAVEHLEAFRRRRRAFATDAEGFTHAASLANAAIRDLGVDQTCALFFTAEREYWQRRNRAAQVQKTQQDLLGLGWANHDHHTYRSSRSCFTSLIAFFEKLSLECRERFYAGRDAGWGAQVMENARAGIVAFNDVDLAPEELLEDFSHQPLAPRNSLGTVGLWCALHGEAFLQAGMHHLECQFDFAALTRRLQQDHGIKVMNPFTDFPYLRQAFTEGERWPVSADRIHHLLANDLITPDQAATFQKNGAIGSHLENLERNEGYKGFNQKGVSEIIAATDPRKQAAGREPSLAAPGHS